MIPPSRAFHATWAGTIRQKNNELSVSGKFIFFHMNYFKDVYFLERSLSKNMSSSRWKQSVLRCRAQKEKLEGAPSECENIWRF